MASLARADLVYGVGSSVARNSPADLMARAGRRLLLHWVGTDVEVAVADHRAGRTSARLLRTATHWADAPWLVAELAGIGVRAECRPLPVPLAMGEVAAMPPEFRVLTYLPAQPGPAYDLEATLEVFEALPEVRFAVFGGYQPPARENVEAAGYVVDMPALYRRGSALLRLTRHDGLSHSVIEALSFGRHVLWSCPFPGAALVRNSAEAAREVRRLHERFLAGSLEPNREGAAAVTETYAWCTIRDEVRRGIARLLT
jgi:hypothetical protein